MDSLDSLSEDEGISELADSPATTQEELEEQNLSQCINPNCKNPKPEMLFSANPYLLTHFRCGPNEKKKICEPCFDNFQQNIHVLKIPPKKTTSPVKVFKEYNDELKKMMGELVEKHLDGFSTDTSDSSSELEDFLSDVDTDVNMEISPLRDELGAESKRWKSEELALQFKKEEEQNDIDIELLKNKFYNTQVTDDNSANRHKTDIKTEIKTETLDIKPSTSHSEQKPLTLVRPISDDQTSGPSSLKDSGPSSPAEPLTPSRPSSPEEPLPPLPPVGPIEKPALNVDDSAYAMQKNNEQEFKLCKITEKKASAYKIRFEGIRTKSKKASPTTTVTGKHLAYVEPSKYRLPVGTRCIAIYREEPDLTEKFFAAIVAESPKLKNWHRYLIFFDDGYTAYLPHEDLRIIVEPLTEVWKDGPCDPDFIQNYLNHHPKQSILRLALDDTIETYHNVDESWVEARVVEVDASLVKLDFGENYEQEWVYSGSSRLKPIHTLEQAKAEKVTEALSGVVPPEDLWKEKKQVGCFEKKGGLVSEEIYKEPKKWEVHDCDWQCISGPGLGYKDGDDREDNLLIIPIKHGWVRRVLQYYEYEKRCVEYVAPCGRRLRNLEEVHAYLKLTGSLMEIDFFNVDWWVHVQNRFQPEKELVSMKDMSFGKENVPVSLVNSVNIEYPEFLAYSKVRLPQNNVKIPLDEEFLVCCDCEDDCSDERKCQCRQLTKKEAGDAVIAGYEFKRLQDIVLTGIYECNSRCKCKHNCHNRVAQKPLRGKLQLFKTVNRGWGIRSLVDIPQGTFICIYVGHLYESDEADKLPSDDYFAQLDLIEVAEEQKGGYVHDDDDEGFAEDGESSKSVNMSQVDGATSESEMEIEPEKEKNSEPNQAKSEESNVEPEPEREKNTEPNVPIQSKKLAESRQNRRLKSVRKCFAQLEGRKEEAYVMDAKLMGNIGRYMNHSCNPNVFVQNVFVDTHDLRFPWVAFFAFTFIKAGDELCWNYNYELLEDSEPLMCNCGATVCKGRLL